MKNTTVHMHLSVRIDTSITNNFVKVPPLFSKAVVNQTQGNTSTSPLTYHEDFGVKALRLGWIDTQDKEQQRKEVFVSWNGQVGSSSCLTMSPLLAKNIGLTRILEDIDAVDSDIGEFNATEEVEGKDGKDTPLDVERFLLSVSLVSYSPIATRVDVDPVDASDWNLLTEHEGRHATFVEENLLTYICVVYPHQVFSIAVNPRQTIRLKVINIIASGMVISSHCVKLARNTEVVIAPKVKAENEEMEKAVHFSDAAKNQDEQSKRLLERQKLGFHLRVQRFAKKTSSEFRDNFYAHVSTSTFQLLRKQLSQRSKSDNHAKNRQSELAFDIDSNTGVIIWRSVSTNTATEQTPVVFWISQPTAYIKLLKAQKVMETLQAKMVVKSKEAQQAHRDDTNAKLEQCLSLLSKDMRLPILIKVVDDWNCESDEEATEQKQASVAPLHILLPEYITSRCNLEELSLCAVYTTLDNSSSAPILLTLPPIIALKVHRDGMLGSSLQSRNLVLGALISGLETMALTEQVAISNASGMTLTTLDLQKCFGREVEIGFPTLGKTSSEEQTGDTTFASSMKKLSTCCDPRVYVVPVKRLLTALKDQMTGQSATQVLVDISTTDDLASSSANQRIESICLNDLASVENLTDSFLKELCSSYSRAYLQKLFQSKFAPFMLPTSSVYLYGGRLVGKTSFVRAFSEKLRHDPAYLVNPVYLNCVDLKNKKRSEIEAVFVNLFAEIEGTGDRTASSKQGPWLVILDDLDILLPNSENNSYDAQTLWLAEYLSSRMTELHNTLAKKIAAALEDAGRDEITGQHSLAIVESLRSKQVCFLATGKERTSLIRHLRTKEAFGTKYNIPVLSSSGRRDILQAILKGQRSVLHNCDLDEVAAKCDGFTAGDLANLVDRAIQYSNIRLHQRDILSAEVSRVPTLGDEDFNLALNKFIPISLLYSNVSDDKAETGDWESIGGLVEEKAELMNTLQKPLAFSRLFDLCPHKQASGVLLYGPPGCGKTLVAQSLVSGINASAAAKFGGLKVNFISVKGPEVLDKYIGASEQNVRDLFAKAQSAAPCILFFDEFEALAPRRGSDSTGVTDRVVNQLLTFLDGVEETTGVYVVAASSRPDMLDPALLRPGRLDKHIFLDFPTQRERRDILLNMLCKEDSMPYDGDAKHYLEELETTISSENSSPVLEGYSGADLTGIITTAQVEAMHDYTGNDYSEELGLEGSSDDKTQVESREQMNGSSAAAGPLIQVEHLKKAVSESRPSVSQKEREKLATVYRKFRGAREAQFEHVSGFDEGKLRTALK